MDCATLREKQYFSHVKKIWFGYVQVHKTESQSPVADAKEVCGFS